VISIAAPNHWHSLMTIWACQAGKDVYVEKPLSHNVAEGRRAVEAARKYGRIVQHGTQTRSNEPRANEIAAVQSGKYGRLRVSKGYCCKPRWSIGYKPLAPPPSDLAFDLWLGPAPSSPTTATWFTTTGIGFGILATVTSATRASTNSTWRAGRSRERTLPTRVWSLGGRFAYEDQGQVPNTQMAVYEYGDVLLVFEVRGLVDKHPDFKLKVLNEYYTTEGMITDRKFYPRNGSTPEPLAEFPVKVTPGGAWGSFLHAVRSAKSRTSMPTSSTAITRARFATWRTSPTVLASRFPSTKRPGC
jgi:hypothetical protein